MIPTTRTWFKNSGASAEAIAVLRAAAPAGLPEKYYELLTFSDGGEGPLPVQPGNFCLDTAAMAAVNAQQRTSDEFFAEFFVFGGNGGGELVAFDLRTRTPWPVVSIDATNVNLDESVQLVASDFDAFVEMIGLEAED